MRGQAVGRRRRPAAGGPQAAAGAQASPPRGRPPLDCLLAWRAARSPRYDRADAEKHSHMRIPARRGPPPRRATRATGAAGRGALGLGGPSCAAGRPRSRRAGGRRRARPGQAAAAPGRPRRAGSGGPAPPNAYASIAVDTAPSRRGSSSSGAMCVGVPAAPRRAAAWAPAPTTLDSPKSHSCGPRVLGFRVFRVFRAEAGS
jgi:hypothetical protein